MMDQSLSLVYYQLNQNMECPPGLVYARALAADEAFDQAARRAWSSMSTMFLSNEQHDRVHEVCAALSLPHPGALKLLLHLDEEDPPTMGGIARLMNCDASYVTALVDALEEPGLAERRVGDSDRRVKTVNLTGPGRSARTRAREMLSEPPTRMDRLTPDEIHTLANLLEKLTAEALDHTTAAPCAHPNEVS
jgi:DNA-binding MarR family transcriptional regulator